MLEILYVSVALMTAYQSQLLLRRAGPGQRTYALLLALDGLCAAGAVVGARYAPDETSVALLGAVALFGFVGLSVVPPILRELTRLALSREKLALAAFLARLRDHLSPGMGGREERELIAVVRSVRSGDVEGALETLRAQRDAAPGPRARAALEDRMVLTLLSAARWTEAIAAYERARAAGGPASLPLAGEMVRAYGEQGDLERAVEIVAFLEGLPGSDEPGIAAFVARARMLFLAYAGRPESVRAAFAGVSLPAAARAYWLGTAHHFAGDADAARAELRRAFDLSGSDTRGRSMAETRLATPPVAARELSPSVAAFADHAARAAVAAPPLVLPGRGRTPATVVLIAANVLVFAVITALLGSSEDGWVLARAGANLKSAVRAGELWRLLSSVFVHVGVLHLALNMVALWTVGRLVEQLLGSVRYAVIYVLAGIGGALASVWWGGGGLSAGASGAVFGIVGSAIVELALLRRGGRAAGWRRLILGNLVFAVVAQLAIGFRFPIIDQSAHVGGLIVGAGAALLLSPAAPFGRTRAVSALAVVLLGLACAAALASTLAVVVTPYDRTLARGGWERRALGPASLEVPRSWVVTSDAVAFDPTRFATLQVKQIARTDIPAVAYAVKQDLTNDQMIDVEQVEPSLSPEGWNVDELQFRQAEDGRFRALLFTRDEGAAALLVSVLVPEARLAEARPLILRLLGSVRVP